MNKHELKSLLENIYTALTEEAAAPKLTIQQILDLSTGGVRLGTASDIVPPPPPPKPNRPMTNTLDQLIRGITTLGRMLQTEEGRPPLPPGLAPGGGPVWAPRLLLPGSPTGPPPTPKPKPRLKPPVATPVPPKPKPTPTPNPELSSPRPRFDPTNPFDPRNPFRLPNPPKPPPLSPGQQQIRDALRELGFPESEIEQIIN